MLRQITRTQRWARVRSRATLGLHLSSAGRAQLLQWPDGYLHIASSHCSTPSSEACEVTRRGVTSEPSPLPCERARQFPARRQAPFTFALRRDTAGRYLVAFNKVECQRANTPNLYEVRVAVVL